MGKSTKHLEKKILQGLAELRDAVADPSAAARRAPSVSGWSAAEHAEHLVLTNNSILDGLFAALEKSEQRPERITGFGRLVLALGWIPRGKGKAIEPVQPKDIPHDGLLDSLDRMAGRIGDFAGRVDQLEAAGATLKHPYFGHLGPRRWLRFIDIHQRHHLKILADMRRADPA